MKNTFIIILFSIGFTALAQTKTFTGTLENYDCGDDRCSFAITKADGNLYEEDIKLEYDAQQKPLLTGEFQDIVIMKGEYEVLNPKYRGMKLSFTCKVKNNIYYVTKIEEPGKVQEVVKDNFPKATCKIYRQDGTLVTIWEEQTIYAVLYNGEKEKKGTPVQNGNEICVGTNCMKVKLDKDGYILVYYLPNTTDAKIIGKIEGDKIYKCKEKDGSDKKLKASFKGNKTQAAVMFLRF